MTSLQSVWDEYALTTRGLSPRTRQWYDEKIGAFVAWCDRHDVTQIEELTVPLVRQYIGSLHDRHNFRDAGRPASQRRPLSSWTIRGHAQVISTFLKWCADDTQEYLPPKMGRAVIKPRVQQKVIQTFTPSQVRALMAACKHEPWPKLVHRDKTILAILLDTGIRASELCGLTVDAVHLSRDDAYLEVLGKGRKSREVGLPSAEAVRLLMRYLRTYRTPQRGEQHLFINRFGEAITPYGLDKILKRLRDVSGVTDVRVSAHTFRHTYAVNYLAGGGDIYALSRLLGHTSVTVTEIYLRDYQQRNARRNGPSVFDSMGA